MDTLVEAEGREQLALQGGVVDDVVVGEGLLDQQQAQGVERVEERGVRQGVGRVGIDLQRRLWVRGRSVSVPKLVVKALLSGRRICRNSTDSILMMVGEGKERRRPESNRR